MDMTGQVHVPERVARFLTVSETQFVKDAKRCLPDTTQESILDAFRAVTLPSRATAGSSGYDIRTPFFFRLRAGEDIVIPTGLRAQIREGWWLMLMPRSGLGFRLYTRLANTVGNIDSDYFNAANEGHIMVKLRLELERDKGEYFDFPAGTAFCQGVFVPFGITLDDCADAARTGGFGSTGR